MAASDLELEKKKTDVHHENVSDEHQQYEQAELEPKLNLQTILAFLVTYLPSLRHQNHHLTLSIHFRR